MECLNNDQLTTTIPFNKSSQQKIVDKTIFVYPYRSEDRSNLGKQCAINMGIKSQAISHK